MKNRDEILRELLEVAPELAKLNKVNLYQAPENYFTHFNNNVLPKLMLSDVQQELQFVAPELQKANLQSESEVPGNYFSSFSSSLLEKIRTAEAAEELHAIAPTLGKLQKVNVYEAPANYFTAFPNKVLKQVNASQSVTKELKPSWLDNLNAALDGIINSVFKPHYTFAFAGSVAAVVIAAMFFTKVETIEQCAKDDLLCQLEKVNNEDIDAYFESHPDEFHKSVLETSTDDAHLNTKGENQDLSFEKYLLNNVSDEELDKAILN